MALTTAQLQQMVEEGQRLRGWISNGYAQVEYLLGDLITRARGLPEYSALGDRLPHRVDRRIAEVRQILEVEGYFSGLRDRLERIIAAFEAHHDTRNLLAHGFCTAQHTPDDDFGLEFRKWHRDGDRDAELIRTFRLADLEYEKAQITHIAQEAVKLAYQIHSELGLVE